MSAVKRTLVSIGAILLMGLCACAGELTGPPDSAAIYEEAGTSDMRVLFKTGFEEADPPKMVHYYGGKVPNKVGFVGLTDEEAHGGKRSYKMQITFEPGRWGNAYFKLPIDIPQWSDIHAKFHVKMDSLPKTWSFHGFVGAQASAGVGGNNINGEKKGEDAGWEVWEVTAKKTSDVGDYVQGIGLRMQLPDHSPATTVTIYLDDVEITGKLPSNYAEKWAGVYRYFTVDREEYIRRVATRRLAGMQARYAQHRREHRRVNLAQSASQVLKTRYAAVCEKIEADLAAVGPRSSRRSWMSRSGFSVILQPTSRRPRRTRGTRGSWAGARLSPLPLSRRGAMRFCPRARRDTTMSLRTIRGAGAGSRIRSFCPTSRSYRPRRRGR